MQTGLNWQLHEYKAIQKIVINPLNAQTLYAATSDGIYKRLDGGTTWSLSLTVLAAMDIVINPIDTSVLYALSLAGWKPSRNEKMLLVK